MSTEAGQRTTDAGRDGLTSRFGFPEVLCLELGVQFRWKRVSRVLELIAVLGRVVVRLRCAIGRDRHVHSLATHFGSADRVGWIRFGRVHRLAVLGRHEHRQILDLPAFQGIEVFADQLCMGKGRVVFRFHPNAVVEHRPLRGTAKKLAARKLGLGFGCCQFFRPSL